MPDDCNTNIMFTHLLRSHCYAMNYDRLKMYNDKALSPDNAISKESRDTNSILFYLFPI